MTLLRTLPHPKLTAERGHILTPETGQLWSLTWDGKDLGLVLLVGVFESYFTAWPVTDESVTPSAPCFTAEANQAEEPLVFWPEAETGMSNALLSECFGEVLTERQVRHIRAALRGGEPLDGVMVYPEEEGTEGLARLSDVCETAAGWGDLDRADPQRVAVLNDVVATEMGLDAAAIWKIIGETPGIAREVAAGRRRLEPEWAVRIASAVETKVDLIWTTPRGPEVVLLRSPEVKADIVSKAVELAVSEDEVRDRAWQLALLAARQSGDAAKADLERVRHAIQSLADA